MNLSNRHCHADPSAGTSAEYLGDVARPRPLRKTSTPVLPMGRINEDKASFWKLLLSSEKPQTQSPVMYFMHFS